KLDEIIRKKYYPDVEKIIKKKLKSGTDNYDSLSIHSGPSMRSNSTQSLNLTDANSEENLSLNAFFNRYTSEDNESFNKLMIKRDQDHQKKYPHIYIESANIKENQKLQALNSLYFTPKALPTASDTNAKHLDFKKPKASSQRQVIKPSNTRMKSNTGSDTKSNQASFRSDKLSLHSLKSLEIPHSKIYDFLDTPTCEREEEDDTDIELTPDFAKYNQIFK
ncbi:MAG: hypothetical protein MHPSP_004321, partial [Paramarteilia canceri]